MTSDIPGQTNSENSAGHISEDHPNAESKARRVKDALKGKSIVFVGIMGVGKSTIGRRVARLLNLPFADADSEIELAADLSIAEIFEKYGEPYFRAGERKVIERLLGEGQQLLATGGGAFMDPETRATISRSAVSLWLDADIDLVMQRVSRRKTRPLLQNPDPRKVIENLMETRNPVYAEANCHFISHDVSRDVIAGEIVELLYEKLVIAHSSDEKLK